MATFSTNFTNLVSGGEAQISNVIMQSAEPNQTSRMKIITPSLWPLKEIVSLLGLYDVIMYSSIYCAFDFLFFKMVVCLHKLQIATFLDPNNYLEPYNYLRPFGAPSLIWDPRRTIWDPGTYLGLPGIFSNPGFFWDSVGT